jgi:hypothetical protein
MEKKFLLFCKKSEMTAGILNSLIKLAKLKKRFPHLFLQRFLAANNNKNK